MAYFDVDRRHAGTMPGASLTGSIGPGPGEKSAGEYLVSGIPYVKYVTQDGNTNQLTFPRVTQWVIVTNHGAASMSIGFSESGVDGTNYYKVAAGATTPKFDIRTKSIWYDGTSSQKFSVMAGLTGILTGSFEAYENNTYWGT